MPSLQKDTVGLDIEPGYVAAVQGTPGRVAVTSAACAALPAGAVRDGEVVDVEAVANSLRELFAQHKLPKRVRLGVANQRIVMRMIDLPPIKGAGLSATELDARIAQRVAAVDPTVEDQVVRLVVYETSCQVAPVAASSCRSECEAHAGAAAQASSKKVTDLRN